MPKNCTTSQPVRGRRARCLPSWSTMRRVVVVAARGQEGGAGQPGQQGAPRDGRRERGDHARTYPRPDGFGQPPPRGRRASPSRCPTTARRCWRCCATGCGCASAKDGCSPQGQCGCCTVLVDGAPRVACVTPAAPGRRAVDHHPRRPRRPAEQWAEAFCATGASQCGFCTPGIIVRLPALRARGTAPTTPARSTGRCPPTCAGAPGGARSLDAWRWDTARRRPGARPRRRRSRGRPSRAAPASGSAPDVAARATAGSPTTRRRPTRSSPCPTARRLGGRRDAGRGPGRRGQGAGAAHDGRPAPAARAAARRLGRHAADHMGGARPTSRPTRRGARRVASP